MKPYHEHIDESIIKILYENEKISSLELKKHLDQSLLNQRYHKTAPDTYWGRLRQLTSSYKNEQSKYVIQPVLTRYEEIQQGKLRGTNVFYGLTKTASVRYALQLPFLESDSKIEKAYRLLFYYMVFYYNSIRKLKNEHEYNELLDKLHINKNELKLLATSDFKEFKITKWLHPESNIEITRKDFLQPSGKEGTYEYSYMLPGISPLEFEKIRIIGLTYQQLDYTKDELFQYFGLLEKKKLIKRIKLKQLEYLNEERYTLVDNSLRNLLADCWTLQSHVFTYLEYRWQSMSKPTNKEKMWFEHLWGKNRTNKWFMYCHSIRKEYQIENRNQLLKETKERIDWEKSEILNKFESIKKEHAKTINEYSFFIDPLLNVIYPDFLRKEFNQNY